MALHSTPNSDKEVNKESDTTGVMFNMACEVFEVNSPDGASSSYVIHHYFDEKSSQAVDIQSGEKVAKPQLIVSSKPNNE